MAAEIGTQSLQIAETPHVALAPGGDAVAQPVFFALNLTAKLVLLDFFLFQNLVAPLLEMGKATGEAARQAAAGKE